MISDSTFQHIKHHAVEKLKNGLHEDLIYHSLEHTTEDVLPTVIRLADLEKISEPDSRLLKIGALFHGIGYTEQYTNHEETSARIAADTLPNLGCTSKQVKTITGIILATRIPQQPTALLEQIICDADLDSLGRDDFFIQSMKLRMELCRVSGDISLKEWLERQLLFLEEHKYFTASARSSRDAGKQKNIIEIKQLLK